MYDATESGWSNLAAQRAVEDERLIERYAQGEGRGRDMTGVRDFVHKVRRDLGPRAVICEVSMEPGRDGEKIVVGYYFPNDNAGPCATPLRKGPDVSAIPTVPGVSMTQLSDKIGGALHPASPGGTSRTGSAVASSTYGAGETGANWVRYSSE